MEKSNLRKSETTAVTSDESCKMIVDELLTEIFDTIANKFYKLKCVEVYYDVVKELLTEIIDVYDKPKPCSDHTHIIEAWKRDKPAQVAEPDILIKNCVWHFACLLELFPYACVDEWIIIKCKWNLI